MVYHMNLQLLFSAHLISMEESKSYGNLVFTIRHKEGNLKIIFAGFKHSK